MRRYKLFWTRFAFAAYVLTTVAVFTWRESKHHKTAANYEKLLQAVLAKEVIINEIGASIDSIEYARTQIRLINPPSVDSLERLFAERYRRD